jgi:bacterioferritin
MNQDIRLSDRSTLRERARQGLENGAMTPGYAGDRDEVVRLLNEALATELLCTLRYRSHYFLAQGTLAEAVKQEFLAHAQEELAHADRIAQRIVQLGGRPDFDPAGITERSHAEFGSGTSLEELVREDLIAERVAIQSYAEMVAFLEGRDSTTRRMLEEILAVEEEHAEEFASLLQDLQGQTTSTGASTEARPAAGASSEQTSQQIMGEGDYAASRRYRQRVERFVKTKDIDAAARDAAPRSTEEAAALQAAEQAGKARARQQPGATE